MVRFSVRTGLRPQDTHVRMYTGLAILRIKPALPPVHSVSVLISTKLTQILVSDSSSLFGILIHTISEI